MLGLLFKISFPSKRRTVPEHGTALQRVAIALTPYDRWEIAAPHHSQGTKGVVGHCNERRYPWYDLAKCQV